MELFGLFFQTGCVQGVSISRVRSSTLDLRPEGKIFISVNRLKWNMVLVWEFQWFVLFSFFRSLVVEFSNFCSRVFLVFLGRVLGIIEFFGHRGKRVF